MSNEELLKLLKEIEDSKEQAAVDYSTKKWVTSQVAVNKDGFKAGAKWLADIIKANIKKDLV